LFSISRYSNNLYSNNHYALGWPFVDYFNVKLKATSKQTFKTKALKVSKNLTTKTNALKVEITNKRLFHNLGGVVVVRRQRRYVFRRSVVVFCRSVVLF